MKKLFILLFLYFICSNIWAMRQRAIFTKVKNFVDTYEFTIQQVKDVTDAQVKSLLNLTDEEYFEYRRFAPGIKKLIIQDLQEEIDKQTLSDFKAQINTWLSTRFPDYEVEKNFEDKNNRQIIFYLDGKQE